MASIKTCCEFYDLNEDSVKTDMWNRKCTPQEAIERAIEWKKAHEINISWCEIPITASMLYERTGRSNS